MTAKDVLLLPRHSYQPPTTRSEFKKKIQTSFDQKAYLGAEFFLAYSNSEFQDDNSFHLKDKRAICGHAFLEVVRHNKPQGMLIESTRKAVHLELKAKLKQILLSHTLLLTFNRYRIMISTSVMILNFLHTFERSSSCIFRQLLLYICKSFCVFFKLIFHRLFS